MLLKIIGSFLLRKYERLHAPNRTTHLLAVPTIVYNHFFHTSSETDNPRINDTPESIIVSAIPIMKSHVATSIMRTYHAPENVRLTAKNAIIKESSIFIYKLF